MSKILLPSSLVEAGDWLSASLAEAVPAESALSFSPNVRPASVLMAMLWHQSAPTILLTQRSFSLPHHAGQISFPGGKQEPEDKNAIATALRETYEEIGLPQQQVQVIGTLPRYLTVSDFLITPVIALVDPPVRFTPQPGEVDEVFEVPLQLALDISAYRIETVVHGKRHVEIVVLDYLGYRIWGATARMLYQLAGFLNGQSLVHLSDYVLPVDR